MVAKGFFHDTAKMLLEDAPCAHFRQGKDVLFRTERGLVLFL